MVNVGIYTIHGWYGFGFLVICLKNRISPRIAPKSPCRWKPPHPWSRITHHHQSWTNKYTFKKQNMVVQKGPVEDKCSTQKNMDFPKSCSFSKVYSCMSIVRISLLSSWNHYFYFAAPPIRWVAKRIISCPKNLVPLPSLEHHLNPEFWTVSIPLWINTAKITNPNQNKSNRCMETVQLLL